MTADLRAKFTHRHGMVWWARALPGKGLIAIYFCIR